MVRAQRLMVILVKNRLCFSLVLLCYPAAALPFHMVAQTLSLTFECIKHCRCVFCNDKPYSNKEIEDFKKINKKLDKLEYLNIGAVYSPYFCIHHQMLGSLLILVPFGVQSLSGASVVDLLRIILLTSVLLPSMSRFIYFGPHWASFLDTSCV